MFGTSCLHRRILPVMSPNTKTVLSRPWTSIDYHHRRAGSFLPSHQVCCCWLDCRQKVLALNLSRKEPPSSDLTSRHRPSPFSPASHTSRTSFRVTVPHNSPGSFTSISSFPLSSRSSKHTRCEGAKSYSPFFLDRFSARTFCLQSNQQQQT